MFGVDQKREGMLIAMIAQPPAFGMKLKSVDVAAVKAMPGIRDVFPIKTYKDDYQKGIEPPKNLIEVWHSKRYIVQIYKEGDGIHRISVCRTSLKIDM